MSRYLVFGTIGLALLMYSANMSAIAVAFPEITKSFDSSLVLTGWVLSTYSLAATAAMPLAGKAGDMFGTKPTFLVALFLFTAGSFLSAIAPNIYLLILFRFVQAVGGGSILPLATSIVARAFPKSRQQAIGFFSTILPLGQVIGPNIGGWMTETYGWRSVFWVNIPIGIAIFAISFFLIGSSRKEEASMDLAGAGLFTGALFAVMAGLSQLGDTSGSASKVIAVLLLAGGVAMAWAFLRHERKCKNPIVDLEVLRERPFMASNIYNFLLGICFFGVFALTPLYAVSVYGMSILESGLIITPRSLGMSATSVLTSLCLVKWGYRRPMVLGTIIIAVSLGLMAVEPGSLNFLGLQIGPILLVGLITLLSGIGMGLTLPAANNACIELMPHRIATITGVRGMFRQSGGAAGIAISAIVLQNSPLMTRGFTVVLAGMAVIMLASIPLLYAMPRAPDDLPLPETAPR